MLGKSRSIRLMTFKVSGEFYKHLRMNGDYGEVSIAQLFEWSALSHGCTLGQLFDEIEEALFVML